MVKISKALKHLVLDDTMMMLKIIMMRMLKMRMMMMTKMMMMMMTISNVVDLW